MYAFEIWCTVVLWLSALIPVLEVGVRFPLSAVIHLASECTFARVNPCHVRGIGYHQSDTRVWGDTSWYCDVVTVLVRFDHASYALSSRVVRVPLLCAINSVCREHRVGRVREAQYIPREAIISASLLASFVAWAKH